jgi:hypothetical protein
VISQSLVSRLIKANHWTRKKLTTISNRRSEELRGSYIDDIASYAADDLIFLDESIFNDKTGWRSRGYAPMGEPARYRCNIARGDTYSVLPAIDIDGYLPCTGIKKGYYNREDLLAWIKDQLLPAITAKYRLRPIVIILDNCSTHIGNAVI